MSRYLAWIDTPLNKQIEMIAHLEWAGVVVPVKPDLDHSIPVELMMSIAPEWEGDPYVITLHSEYPANSLPLHGELWLVAGTESGDTDE